MCVFALAAVAFLSFSIRESDRCLETADSTTAVQIRTRFQYPRVGSLPRNERYWRPVLDEVQRFSIRESDRCLETHVPVVAYDDAVEFQYPRVGSLPRNGYSSDYVDKSNVVSVAHAPL